MDGAAVARAPTTTTAGIVEVGIRSLIIFQRDVAGLMEKESSMSLSFGTRHSFGAHAGSWILL